MKPAPLSLPQEIERFCLGGAEALAGGTHGDPLLRLLAPWVRKLSDRFTTGRRHLAETYLEEPALLAAYLAYFAPLSALKAAWAMRWVPERKGGGLKVLDLGTGPGAAFLGALHALRERGTPGGVEVTLLDRSPHALDWASRGASKRQGVRCRAIEADLARLPPGQGAPPPGIGGDFDLVLVSNLLSEVEIVRGPEGSAALLDFALARLGPGGALVVVEPALRVTSTLVERERDRLLRAGAIRVVAPCTHPGPCPALGLPGRWCSMEVPWRPPPWWRSLSRRAGRGNPERGEERRLKFSYLVALPASGRGVAPPSPQEGRAMTGALREKGKWSLLVCREGGWDRLTHLTRDPSEVLEALRRVGRGDRVRWGGGSGGATRSDSARVRPWRRSSASRARRPFSRGGR